MFQKFPAASKQGSAPSKQVHVGLKQASKRSQVLAEGSDGEKQVNLLFSLCQFPWITIIFLLLLLDSFPTGDMSLFHAPFTITYTMYLECNLHDLMYFHELWCKKNVFSFLSVLSITDSDIIHHSFWFCHLHKLRKLLRNFCPWKFSVQIFQLQFADLHV